MSEPAGGVEDQDHPTTRTRRTRDTDERQQDTQVLEPSSSARTPMTGLGDSTVRPEARDIRDTEQFETAKHEPENPGEWTPSKRI